VKNLNKIPEQELSDSLVATNVASRGLDVEDVALVVCYELHKEVDVYHIHRVGRTAPGRKVGSRSAFSEYRSCTISRGTTWC